MKDIETEFLFHITFNLEPAQMIGACPTGTRMTFVVRGGSFTGPQLHGEVLPGGGDWLVVGPDGVGRLDVRATLRTEGGDLIHTYYGGVLAAPPDALQRLGRGGEIGEDEMYFRTAPRFDTGSEALSWLNRMVAVGVGALGPNRVDYRVYKVR